MPPPRCVNVTHRFSLSLPYIRRMNRYHYIIIRARSLLSGIASVFLNYHAPFSPPFFIFLSLSRTWNEKENVSRADRVISLYSSFSFVIKKKEKRNFQIWRTSIYLLLLSSSEGRAMSAPRADNRGGRRIIRWIGVWLASGEEGKARFRRVPDASYASNIAMQAWNIGRTLERSFIYAATHARGSVAKVDVRARARQRGHASARITHRTRYEFVVGIAIVRRTIDINRSTASIR